jgi:hypothetical protein
MPRYEEYYGYPFLDELHNFFPDFLYNNGRFNSVRDVFGYLNQQMNQHFNLYAAGHRLQQRQQSLPRAAAVASQPVPYFDDMNYIDNRNNQNNINNINNSYYNSPAPSGAAAPAAGVQRLAPGVSVVQERRRAAAPAPAVDLFSTEFIIREGGGGLGSGDIAGLAGLASLLVPGGVQPRNLLDIFNQIPGFADPVVVRPSVNEIAAATIVQTQGQAQGEVCPICQDDIITGCQTRKINYCDHKFHKGCIDTWFAQNVHCPVCRHDIRSAPAQSQSDERQVDDETDDGEEDENENIVD